MSDSEDSFVRPATVADMAAIQDIEAAAFEPSRRASARSLRRALTSPFQRVLVLEIGARLAGYLIVWPFRHTWRVYNLATDPDQRNRGVAGALLAAVEQQARAGGARRLVLESQADGALEQFYLRRGFRAQRHLPDYYAKGEHAVRMELLLPHGSDGLPSAGPNGSL